MSTRFENTAVALAGFSLAVVTFAGFSLFRSRTAGEAEFPTESESRPSVRAWDSYGGGSDQTATHAGLGLMGAWRMPAPFTAQELQALADELESERARAEVDAEALRQREERLEESLAGVATSTLELETLRAQLETDRTPPSAESEDTYTRWTEVAWLLSSIPTDEAKSLLALYEPKDAASILHTLEDELRAAELLAALRTVPSIRAWKTYVDAYSWIDDE